MTETSRHEIEDAAERLTKVVAELSEQVHELRQRGRQVVVGAVAIIIAMIITGTLAAVDARYQDREQSHRWCALLDTITSPVPPSQATPTTDRQRKIVDQLNQLRNDFGCR